MKTSLLLLVALFLAGCASKAGVESSTAQKQLQEKYEKRVGAATKEDLIQEFGPANWCRQEDGGEKCRFYKKLKTEWMGDKKDRVHRETYDEVVAEFDSAGKLKTVQATAQR